MDTVTLLHTRWPKDEFIYDPSSGDNLDDVDDLTDEQRGALYRTAGRPLTRSANRKRLSGMWGTMMMVFSLIPGAGTGIVWVPACIILLIMGKSVTALILAIFMAGVVGSIDNILRPRLVGRDTQMHEILILLSTLGGIVLFGVVGFIIGPIVAALFVTIWDLYGLAFRDVLPPNSEVTDRPPQL